MRTTLLCALFALPVFAADFTLESASGEASRDSSSAKSTYVVTGDTVTRTVKHSGRYPFPEDDDPPKVVKLSNLKESDAALAAIRATKDDKKPVKLVDTRYRTGCLVEGQKKYCSTVRGDDKTPRLEAIEKLEQLILSEFLK
jgi:hypothetical protein